jgi:hypothetical protein
MKSERQHAGAERQESVRLHTRAANLSRAIESDQRWLDAMRARGAASSPILDAQAARLIEAGGELVRIRAAIAADAPNDARPGWRELQRRADDEYVQMLRRRGGVNQ